MVTFAPANDGNTHQYMGKSYTTSSLGIPPGLDRSKGTWL